MAFGPCLTLLFFVDLTEIEQTLPVLHPISGDLYIPQGLHVKRGYQRSGPVN